MTFYLIAWNGSRCQLDILKAKENQELRKSGNQEKTEHLRRPLFFPDFLIS